MLGHASAHAVYKFVIESREKCRPVAVVHLVGWNAEIQIGSLCSDETSTFERYAKVMFTKKDDIGFESFATKSLKDDTTELISLPEDDCDELVHILTRNSLFIPPQLRTISGLTRSLLQM
ncbi:hypothetical protein IWW48_000764 [Coemansia sp. RSA 1200]|nr:hypothetical protein IWW48_000764 [Coemansia sp. RSA 1200]